MLHMNSNFKHQTLCDTQKIALYAQTYQGISHMVEQPSYMHF